MKSQLGTEPIPELSLPYPVLEHKSFSSVLLSPVPKTPPFFMLLPEYCCVWPEISPDVHSCVCFLGCDHTSHPTAHKDYIPKNRKYESDIEVRDLPLLWDPREQSQPLDVDGC